MRNVLTMKYPASWHGNMWREAIPVGNGAIGALVYGGAYKEIIAINHTELWYGAQTPPSNVECVAKGGMISFAA